MSEEMKETLNKVIEEIRDLRERLGTIETECDEASLKPIIYVRERLGVLGELLEKLKE